MPEKEKLYMYKKGEEFFASTLLNMEGDTQSALYFTKHGLRNDPQYYKSLKSLAVAIRNAGFYGVDKTQ